MIFKRSRSASWNVIDPFIASFVRRATSWPLPQNCANSSMPSSLITVESTSKHTICVFRITWAAPAAFFDLSPTIFLWFRLKGQRRRRRRRWEKRKCQKWNETKRPEMPHEINQMSSIGKGKWMEERGERGGGGEMVKTKTAQHFVCITIYNKTERAKQKPEWIENGGEHTRWRDWMDGYACTWVRLCGGFGENKWREAQKLTQRRWFGGCHIHETHSGSVMNRFHNGWSNRTLCTVW